jgi:hypothetical protein
MAGGGPIPAPDLPEGAVLAWFRFVAARDAVARFRFIAIQSEVAIRISSGPAARAQRPLNLASVLAAQRRPSADKPLHPRNPRRYRHEEEGEQRGGEAARRTARRPLEPSSRCLAVSLLNCLAACRPHRFLQRRGLPATNIRFAIPA